MIFCLTAFLAGLSPSACGNHVCSTGQGGLLGRGAISLLVNLNAIGSTFSESSMFWKRCCWDVNDKLLCLRQGWGHSKSWLLVQSEPHNNTSATQFFLTNMSKWHFCSMLERTICEETCWFRGFLWPQARAPLSFTGSKGRGW